MLARNSCWQCSGQVVRLRLNILMRRSIIDLYQFSTETFLQSIPSVAFFDLYAKAYVADSYKNEKTVNCILTP